MESVSRSPHGQSPRPLIKIEPTEELSIVSFSESAGDDTLPSAPDIKVEPVIEPTLYQLYDFADEIPYTPENALHEGLGMVKTLKVAIEKLELGTSKLRKDVWLREIDSLLNQVGPTTMIAICGATGAGKSSTINALLDVDVVPTSGMRACTSVVTEVAYHAAPTINADVSFLSEAEWREELIVLLDDLKAEDGNLKRTTDLRGDVEVAWHKVHAIYPSITLSQLVNMTVDQMLTCDPNIARVLGTTRKISADNSRSFAEKIARYIDSSMDHERRGKKDKTRKDKKTSTSDTLVISTEEKKDHDTALWPLIRQVNIRCNARALSTGAMLVDLPGVADVNPARNRIAKDYMKKCNCIWILAPITRAVDDKAARDLLGEAFRLQLMNGNYDAYTITFIATKCDDITCSEVISALDLKDDAVLEEITSRIASCKAEAAELRLKKVDAESRTKTIRKQLEQLETSLQQHQHKMALVNGKIFTPQLTTTAHQTTPGQSVGKKRKNTRRGESGPPKRQKSSTIGEDSKADSDRDMEVDDAYGGQKLVEEEQEEQEKEDTQHHDGIEDESEEELRAVQVLNAKIDDIQEAIKARLEQLHDVQKAQMNIMDALDNLKRKENEARRDQNTFCSLKRSEFSCNVLKEDFRVGLKHLDDTAAEERNPDSFDPTEDLRNYDEIDLPIFTCSSRDYVRITGRIERDGHPSCFSNVDDTGIPALQQWCHRLATGSQSRAAKQFHSQLNRFANSVQVYVDGIGDVIVADSKALREKWESVEGGLKGFKLSAMDNGSCIKVDPDGKPTGITPRLVKDFGACVEKCVSDLQGLFHDGLEDKCRVGAVNAAEGAVRHVDEFAGSMHWNTYRATLRRHGSWHCDLNVELLTPFTRNIASSWSTLFKSDLFTPLSSAITECVNKLLADVEASAAPGLKDCACARSSDSQEEARLALGKIIEVVEEALVQEQKEISRSLAPHVQTELVDGYNLAVKQRGRGSVARQKTVFHDYVDTHKHAIFNGGAEVLLDRLSAAAEAVGKAVNESLRELAEKVEVSISVLWEGMPDDHRVRTQIIQSVSLMLDQLAMWSQAAERVSLAS